MKLPLRALEGWQLVFKGVRVPKKKVESPIGAFYELV